MQDKFWNLLPYLILIITINNNNNNNNNNIVNINNKLKQYKINWRQHIQRMDDNRLSKNILNYKLKGRRNIGRPQTRWEDDFREEGTGQGG